MIRLAQLTLERAVPLIILGAIACALIYGA